ncbi:hypothetical protein [Rheinheimera baltica]|uniref:hypothetical protein n=1 Tax=Rheinheimera baltica TaxID=67576 RepID=UPI00273E9030|nr:hypothetical protein [Rheinheimera baltica]MDP5190413.1 hypothetical protein [Rheinheimera baltica]
MSNWFFISLTVMLVCDAAGIHLLKKEYPKEHKSLGGPVHYWTNTEKMAYLVGFVGFFRFISIPNPKIISVLALQAISFWTCIVFLFYGFYERLS